MAIFRVHRTKNFTTVNNYLIRDGNLTLKDKGMLLVLLSLPDDWEYSVIGLEKICKESKDTINNILNNLEKYEYLERIKLRNNKGQFTEWKYDIYEIPKTMYYNPYPKNQDMEKPDMENYTQLNTKELIKEELNNTTTNTIYDLLQENGFILTPIQYEVVSEWEDNELTKYAIKKAVLNNKFNINYINKILNSYKKENITTVQQAIEQDEEFNLKREEFYKTKYQKKESRYEREQRIMKEWLEKDE